MIQKIPHENRGNTFENFTISGDSEDPVCKQKKSCLTKLTELLKKPLTGASSLVFISGSAGTGKTHLAVSTCHKAALSDWRTVFLTEESFFKYVIPSKANPVSDFIKQYDIFVLDDFNGANKTIEQSWLKPILSEIHATGGKIVVLTSNFPYVNFISRLLNAVAKKNDDGLHHLNLNDQRFMRRITELSEQGGIFDFTKPYDRRVDHTPPTNILVAPSLPFFVNFLKVFFG